MPDRRKKNIRCDNRADYPTLVIMKIIVIVSLSADVSGVDWMVRHGRSMALAIALKSAPEKLCGKEYCDSVTETVLVNATADRVRSCVVYQAILTVIVDTNVNG